MARDAQAGGSQRSRSKPGRSGCGLRLLCAAWMISTLPDLYIIVLTVRRGSFVLPALTPWLSELYLTCSTTAFRLSFCSILMIWLLRSFSSASPFRAAFFCLCSFVSRICVQQYRLDSHCQTVCPRLDRLGPKAEALKSIKDFNEFPKQLASLGEDFVRMLFVLMLSRMLKPLKGSFVHLEPGCKSPGLRLCRSSSGSRCSSGEIAQS